LACKECCINVVSRLRGKVDVVWLGRKPRMKRPPRWTGALARPVALGFAGELSFDLVIDITPHAKVQYLGNPDLLVQILFFGQVRCSIWLPTGKAAHARLSSFSL
jgi:hypothetical protein